MEQREYKISYPKEIYEWEIEAILYNKLLTYGLDARLQVYADESSRCRFDLVVFVNKAAICIIEVKKQTIKGRKKQLIALRQYKDYRRYGLPLIKCIGLKNIDKTIANVLQVCQ
jgi:type I site-specific restriction-modification system R (restriction) subunit